jgi:hypothetical protein
VQAERRLVAATVEQMAAETTIHGLHQHLQVGALQSVRWKNHPFKST